MLPLCIRPSLSPLMVYTLLSVKQMIDLQQYPFLHLEMNNASSWQLVLQLSQPFLNKGIILKSCLVNSNCPQICCSTCYNNKSLFQTDPDKRDAGHYLVHFYHCNNENNNKIMIMEALQHSSCRT